MGRLINNFAKVNTQKTMGWDTCMFKNELIDAEFFCPVCKDVLEDPMHLKVCEHAFCANCIREWLSSENESCPTCRTKIRLSDLEPAPRIMRTLIDKMPMFCKYKPNGCIFRSKVELMRQHLVECEFNPEKPVKYKKGCGLAITQAEVPKHECITHLKKILSLACIPALQDSRQKDFIIQFQEKKIREQEKTIFDLKRKHKRWNLF